MTDRKDYKVNGKCTADNYAKQCFCLRSTVFGTAQCCHMDGHDCTSKAVIREEEK